MSEPESGRTWRCWRCRKPRALTARKPHATCCPDCQATAQERQATPHLKEARFAGQRRSPMLPPSYCRALDPEELAALQLQMENGSATLKPHDEPWDALTAILSTSDGYLYHVALEDLEAESE